MAERIIDKAIKIIKPVVEELGYIFVDLEYKKDFTGNVLALTIDSENGININDCERVSKALDIPLDEEAAIEIAQRSRGTPRIANRILKRVRDYASVLGNGKITLQIAKHALNKLEIDGLGLDEIDRKILETIILKFNGGPVGIEAIATTIGEEVATIEDVYEPYLIQIGFISRTLRGRIALEPAYKHMGVEFNFEKK